MKTTRLMLQLAVLAAVGMVTSHAQVPQAAAPPTIPAPVLPAPTPLYWETTIKIEQYGPRDREPARMQTMVEKQCFALAERSADKLLRDQALLQRLKDKCWESSKREEPLRFQSKWTCSDGTTAELATRIHSDTAFGAMLVFNIPNQGALSVRAETKKIADTCPPEVPAK